MNIADDDQNPRPAKKLSKSLDAIAALRVAMEQRLNEAQNKVALAASNPAAIKAAESAIALEELPVSEARSAEALPPMPPVPAGTEREETKELADQLVRVDAEANAAGISKTKRNAAAGPDSDRSDAEAREAEAHDANAREDEAPRLVGLMPVYQESDLERDMPPSVPPAPDVPSVPDLSSPELTSANQKPASLDPTFPKAPKETLFPALERGHFEGDENEPFGAEQGTDQKTIAAQLEAFARSAAKPSRPVSPEDEPVVGAARENDLPLASQEGANVQDPSPVAPAPDEGAVKKDQFSRTPDGASREDMPRGEPQKSEPSAADDLSADQAQPSRAAGDTGPKAQTSRHEQQAYGGDRAASYMSYDPTEWSRIMFRIADRSQKLVQKFLERQKTAKLDMPVFDPSHIIATLGELTSRIVNNPERFLEAQIALWQGYAQIWQQALQKMQGRDATPIISPASSDKRFKDKDWQNVWLFDFIKQSYLLTAKWAQGLVRQESGQLEPKLAHKVDFYLDQFLDALSPSNFWLTNPEVLRATFESGGENLIKGFENLLEDMEKGEGQLRITMSADEAFKVGHNLATSKGRVVYRNELIELIQYAPTTETVHKTPLLVMPPWINKFYILDMSEKNSFIRYLVSKGHTVFCISWVNPDQRHAGMHFEDYITHGIFAAMRAVKEATGSDDINVTGYCIGGTLLASALAWLNATPEKPKDLPHIKSATYLVTLVDFSEPGDLGVFIDEEQVTAIEARMAKKGYLDAASMATTFNLLRSNDLIWSFVINNYLLGKEPFPFDILYWNSDSTNLPATMHSFYLRKMYLENLLCKPNGLSMNGVPLDLSTITTPSFMLSTREDHIAPWRSTYAGTQIYKGPVTFVLAGSGHIAGIVNPPAANKYGYWTNNAHPKDPEAWLQSAEQHRGSWWPEWMKWLEPFSGGEVPARMPAQGLDAAPGSYVLARNA